ncbi:homoserine O- acetyltransferase [Linnemannia gamsii]|uniref:Homoserine O- acetyltransferase n=1 Tax=Linnemannia gamsii TaxID=64522 RepID=A0ABQ7KIN2_9FUNG|nr:homoserine O- acetyltransferase [Linnemannia gamsii]
MPFERRTTQPENPFANLAPDQTIAIVPEFTFESGHTIRNVPVAYKTWGVLNAAGDNCMLICHPLSRSVDVEDWWRSLMGTCTLEGKGKVIDETKFFIISLNCMGSPYGSASPLTMNPDTGARYGPEFPLPTIRDDCRLHKMVLDDLGVKSVAICIGASMAGMHAFEWTFILSDTQESSSFVKSIVSISAPAKSSAWSMSWTEAQRQAIFADPKYIDGYYPLESPPLQGMTAARMTAMLTYRTRDSYERRFGRDIMSPSPAASSSDQLSTTTAASFNSSEIHRLNHNEGHRNQSPTAPLASPIGLLIPGSGIPKPSSGTVATTTNTNTTVYQPQLYSAHSYLRYQAAKFNERFDANCYIVLSRKMDAHDVSLNRGPYEDVLRSINQPVLVVGIESDVLYTASEIRVLSDLLPNGEHFAVQSAEGHDGVLLEYEQINDAIVAFMQRQEHICELVRREGVAVPEKKTPRGSLFASW